MVEGFDVVVGFMVVGFAVVGFMVVGFAVVGFMVVGCAVVGSLVEGGAVGGFGTDEDNQIELRMMSKYYRTIAWLNQRPNRIHSLPDCSWDLWQCLHREGWFHIWPHQGH
jgi:hypothetical protein